MNAAATDPNEHRRGKRHRADVAMAEAERYRRQKAEAQLRLHAALKPLTDAIAAIGIPVEVIKSVHIEPGLVTVTSFRTDAPGPGNRALTTTTELVPELLFPAAEESV